MEQLGSCRHAAGKPGDIPKCQISKIKAKKFDIIFNLSLLLVVLLLKMTLKESILGQNSQYLELLCVE
jgi:hypothetical protein